MSFTARKLAELRRLSSKKVDPPMKSQDAVSAWMRRQFCAAMKRQDDLDKLRADFAGITLPPGG